MRTLQSTQAQPRPLGELLAGMNPVASPYAALPISHLTLDSRQAGSGSLFFGLPGEKSDGREFVSKAFASGASAAIVESQGWHVENSDRPCFAIANLRAKVGVIADRFFGHPSRTLCVIGVTGTNGKTSCATLLAQALELLGHKSGFIGTPGWGFLDDLEPSTLTTPDAVTLQSHLAALVERGADSVCLEVSSHALDQGRIEGVQFDSAVFTNLSRDHLDYHKSMDAYAQTKLLLFQRQELKSAVINISDPVGAQFSGEKLNARLWTFGRAAPADVFPLWHRVSEKGLSMSLRSPIGEIEFESRLHGDFNVENLMAVVTTLVAQQYSSSDISRVMARLDPVIGRMNLCKGSGGLRPTVVIDYAHSPGALKASLESARSLTRGALWCVFGCGGERDRGKRPTMGQLASALADHVVLTNDNPRGEVPSQILSAIETGLERPADAVIPDRAQAIAYAIENASPHDLILIAGKGHERFQLIGNQAIPFSDREVAEQLLGMMPC